MSTRDEILAALTDHPEGLTSKELAPLCPSAECDSMIVGRVIAGLRTEDVIHPGTELRDGATIWIFGKSPRVEVREPPVTLPEGARPAASVSEAARAIAAMRTPAAGLKNYNKASAAAAAATESPPAPAKAQQENHQEKPMATIREKIEAALREHGPMTSREIGKYVKAEGLGQNCAELAARGALKKLGNKGPRSTIYGLPGQKKGDAAPEPEAPQQVKTNKKPQLRSIRRAAPAPSAPRRDARTSNEGDAKFAINEQGELGIELEGQKLRLDSEAFARLRDFIGRTEPVWKVAA